MAHGRFRIYCFAPMFAVRRFSAGVVPWSGVAGDAPSQCLTSDFCAQGAGRRSTLEEKSWYKWSLTGQHHTSRMHAPTSSKVA